MDFIYFSSSSGNAWSFTVIMVTGFQIKGFDFWITQHVNSLALHHGINQLPVLPQGITCHCPKALRTASASILPLHHMILPFKKLYNPKALHATAPMYHMLPHTITYHYGIKCNCSKQGTKCHYPKKVYVIVPRYYMSLPQGPSHNMPLLGDISCNRPIAWQGTYLHPRNYHPIKKERIFHKIRWRTCPEVSKFQARYFRQACIRSVWGSGMELLGKEIRLCDEIEALKRNLKFYRIVWFVNESTQAI